MKHVKQLLSALLVLAVVLSLLPAGVLKASAAEAPAALDIGYPTFKNTELLDEVYEPVEARCVLFRKGHHDGDL